MCLSVLTVVELEGVPRPNGGAGHGGWPEESAELVPHTLTHAEWCRTEGLGVACLLMEHIRGNEAPETGHNSQSS